MKISASQVLAGARTAMPANILKLTDPSIYEQVPYEEFRGAIIGHPKEKQLNELLDMTTSMLQGVPEKRDRIYIYFILSLSQILLEVNDENND